MTEIVRSDYQRKDGVKQRVDTPVDATTDLSQPLVSADGDTTITGTLTLATMMRWPVNDPVAAAGSTAADAALVTTGVTKVTGADGTKGVALPSPSKAGFVAVVYNSDATHLLPLYSARGGTLLASVNAAAALQYIAVDASGTWVHI